MGYRVGTGEIDITPPVGTLMGGFGNRTHGAVGIHDPLRAKALAISDGENTALLITNDMLSIPYDLVNDIHAEIGGRVGLKPEQIMLNYSHTHSGPRMRGVRGRGRADEVYTANYVQQLGGLAEMAMRNLAPVRITSHRGPLQVGINRREHRPDGNTVLGQDPEGIVDRHVDVLRFMAEDGTLRAILFSHATHGVTLGGNNYYFSADWMGYAQRRLEAVYPGATVAFAQGCCGNINTVPVGGTFEDARRLGTRAAGGVMMALESAGSELQGPVRFGRLTAQLPQQDPPPREATLQRIQDCEQALADARDSVDQARIQHAEALASWARWLDGLASEGVTGQTLPLEISAIAIGRHAILGLAGEVFFEYASNIAEASPFEFTTVLGTTNGCIAYIPTAAEMPYGGYEVDGSMVYYMQLWLKPEAEEVAVEAAVELLARLRD